MRKRADPNQTAPHIAQRAKWYGTQRWKRLRRRVLARNPGCAICGVAPATQADHIQHTKSNELFWKLENIRPACAECNNRLGARAAHATGRGYHATKNLPAATAPPPKKNTHSRQVCRHFQPLQRRPRCRTRRPVNEAQSRRFRANQRQIRPLSCQPCRKACHQNTVLNGAHWCSI